MMVRMERATAHLALSAPMRQHPAEPFTEEGAGAGGAGGGLGAVALEVGVALSLARPAAAGAGLAHDGSEPGPGDQVIGSGEPGHVQAGLGDDRPGELGADAGDLREPFRRRAGPRSRVSAGAGAGLSVGADCPGGGDGVQGSLDLVLEFRDGPVQQGDVVEVDADQPGWWPPSCMPSRDLSMAARPPLTWASARAASVLGSRSPSAMASRMPRAVFVLARDERRKMRRDQLPCKSYIDTGCGF